MDIVTLSRIQFALNISFHYLFPPLSVGLSLLLIMMEGAYLRTKNPVYKQMTHFWVKIFALIFAIGVATGLVQVFGFGTNWSQFSRFVGDVFGSILGAEGIFAFFLESGFLGVLLFGWRRVSAKVHFFSTIMVSVGAHFSALWIVIANSWMQTPAGHVIVGEGSERHAEISNFWQVLLNPSTADRITHVLFGCWLSGAFLVLSVSSWYLLKKRHLDLARKAFTISLCFATFGVAGQLVSGDHSSRFIAQHQPIKLAAFEGVYTTETPTGMYAFGIVDTKKESVKGLSLPGMLSFLVYRNLKEPVAGLDQYPKELWPKVGWVFQTYHGMIIMWGLMAIGVSLALYAVWRNQLLESKKTLRFLVIAVLFPQIANQLGWYSAEMGRQPWAVYNILKTSDGVSPTLSPNQIIFSITLFSLIYLLLFALFIYLLDHKIRSGPPDKETVEEYRDPYKGFT